MDLIEGFIRKAQRNPVRIVYPEGHDPRIVAAAAKAAEKGVAHPVVVGSRKVTERVALEQSVSLDGVQIVSPNDEHTIARYAEEYSGIRDIRESIAGKLVKKPLPFAGMMVRVGDAEGMVAGVASATASVIQAASLTIGFGKGMSTPSSFFIMIVPEFLGQKDKILVFADCAVNVSPSPRQLAETAVASGRNAEVLLGLDPFIAFLSFSTKGSADHEDVRKVVEAVRIAKELEPGFRIDGELQADAAIEPNVAARKVKGSAVAGRANVLIFPDLDAGNMSYKLVQYLAGGRAIGPILQGFSKPVNDVSRGATVDDLLGVTAVTVIQAQNAECAEP